MPSSEAVRGGSNQVSGYASMGIPLWGMGADSRRSPTHGRWPRAPDRSGAWPSHPGPANRAYKNVTPWIHCDGWQQCDAFPDSRSHAMICDHEGQVLANSQSPNELIYTELDPVAACDQRQHGGGPMREAKYVTGQPMSIPGTLDLAEHARIWPSMALPAISILISALTCGSTARWRTRHRS